MGAQTSVPIKTPCPINTAPASMATNLPPQPGLPPHSCAAPYSSSNVLANSKTVLRDGHPTVSAGNKHATASSSAQINKNQGATPPIRTARAGASATLSPNGLVSSPTRNMAQPRQSPARTQSR
ncbi:unnamed protein product [Pleuronectes platessa]|uniref:Uncharacterized protein n=1 Tax=Pleuronectes platessa TaxID=8262 RepID=A0A9N7YTF6_PLEPL|nr:unnamed protein product [Pleuronectes platessa]